jgi:cysteine desulfurase
MRFFVGKTRVYADAAAATPLEPAVRARLVELLDIYGNPGALHDDGVAAKRALEAARTEAAGAIGAHTDEIVFTASGTEANNLAILGTFEAQSGAGHAVTLLTEHPSVLEPLRAAQKKGATVNYLPVTPDGLASPQTVAAAISNETVLISVALINSEIGVVQDIRAIAKAVREERTKRGAEGKPLYLHVDASQAPYWMRLRTDALHADLLTLDAQKCGGPKGVGLLYIRRGTAVAPQMRGGSQERGLRAGTENVPLAGAFARALSLAQASSEENAARIALLRDDLLQQIRTRIPDARLSGSMESRVANNLNISIPGLMGEMAVIALSQKGVAASTRSACSETDEDASHVLTALGLSSADAQSTLRFTLLPTATPADISRIARAVGDVYARYKAAP